MKIKYDSKYSIENVIIPFKYSQLKSKPSPAFPNRKIALRPLVTIYFPLADGTNIGYQCLIDSGSDFCFFHKEIGEEVLGLNIGKGKKLPNIRGIIKDKNATFDAYFHTIRFYIMGWGIDEAYVGFADRLGVEYGILGQHAFFDIFQITFDKPKEGFRLIPTISIEKGKIEPYEVTKVLRVKRGQDKKT